MKIFFSVCAAIGIFFNAPLFSECTDDFCSFDSGSKTISFYGSRGAYRFYEGQNTDKHTFEGMGSTLSLEKISKGDLDAGFFITDEKGFEELCGKGKLSQYCQDIFLIGSGKVILMGNLAFFKALKKKSVTTNDLQEMVLSGKINTETFEWHVSPITSSTEALGWQALLKGLNQSPKVKKVEVDSQESLTKSKEYGMSKTPIVYFNSTSLLEYYKNEKDLAEEGWQEIIWNESPSLNYYIAVLKGPNYDTIISNLKSMKAQRAACK